ncbi:TetR/AcrR family transcriptional regulator [Mycobacterium sp. C31M]
MASTRSADALVQSTVALIAESGVDTLTLSQVAAHAGVSRATAYREFGDKNGLLSSVAEHEIRRMFEVTVADVDLSADPAAVIPAIVLSALRYLRQHKAFSYVREHEPHRLLQAVLTVGDTELNLVQTVAVVVAAVARLSDHDGLALPAVQAAEIVVRAVLSHTLLPGSALDDQQVADVVARAVTRPMPR